MERKNIILLGVGTGLAAVVCAAVLLWPTVRQAVSVAESVSMNEEEVQARAEENEKIETEVRERYNIPDIQVSEDINAALADGSTTLEEAAAMLLEQSGGVLPGLENVTGGGTGTPSAQTGSAAQTAEGEAVTVPWPDFLMSGQSSDAQVQEPDSQSRSSASGTQTPVQQSPAPVEQETRQTEEDRTGLSRQEQEALAALAVQEQEQLEKEDKARQAEQEQQEEEEGLPEQAQQSEKEKKIQNLIAQAYVLKSSFTSRLDGIMEECISEFLALDESEQTTSNKVRIVSARLKTVSAMEKECDAQVASLVSQLRELDPDAADQMAQQYQNEKTLKKRELVQRYG